MYKRILSVLHTIDFSNLKIYSSVYEYINSNMYIILSQDEAVVIDPHWNESVSDFFEEKHIKKVTIMLTHEHPDHISGVWWFLENFDCKLICSEKCAAKIADKRHTRPLLISFAVEKDDEEHGTHNAERFKNEYVWTAYKADIAYKNEMRYEWHGHLFHFYEAAGHSDGGSFIVLDEKYTFTGDSLMKDYPVIVSFPHSDKEVFQKRTLPLLEKTLLPQMTILPGHGKPFILGDIMQEGKIHVELR